MGNLLQSELLGFLRLLAQHFPPRREHNSLDIYPALRISPAVERFLSGQSLLENVFHRRHGVTSQDT
jgi:hypothetical protein